MLYDNFVTWDDSRSNDTQLYARCPLHSDDTASFTVNLDKNVWYCHGCHKGGTEVEFIAEYYGVGKKIAHKAFEQYEARGLLPFPTVEYFESCHKALKARPSEMAVLKGFGISETIIDELMIGLDDIRIVFPIKSMTGAYVNARKYLPPHRRTEYKEGKVINMKFCGENRIYPYSAFFDTPLSEPIYIVEGEKDMAVARSKGYNAVTGLAGTIFPITDAMLFHDRVVYIMVDTDAPGKKYLKQIEKALAPITKSIHKISLPTKDTSEFFEVSPEGEVMEYVHADPTSISGEGEAAIDTILVESENVNKLNSWITLRNMSVIGTDPKTYSIPATLKPVCKNEECQKGCSANSGIEIEIPVDPRQQIQFIDSPDRVQDQYLQKMMGCKHVTAEPIKYINAQKIMFQESTSFVDGLEDTTFEHRYGIFLYESQRLSPTQKYNFECIRVADPRSQQNYYVIRKAERVDLQLPGITRGATTFIDYFADMSAKCSTVMELLTEHYKLWMSSLNIEGRVDLFGAIVLTYLSVTEIYWRGGNLKGWLDTMVIGDTRTGKSQMAQRFVKTLQRGGYINGENARATGVIGGVQQMGGSWLITWGAIPMNDKGLLIVDEASGLSIDDIKDLSATRSSGAVSINKIAKGEASARTRLLWLSNPRSGKNLAEFYWRGYGAFVEFIPIVEDQARYDLVLTAAREDVLKLEGYKDDGPEPSLENWQQLVDYAWSVPANKIQISDQVASHIAKVAEELDDRFGGGPLVVGVAVHEKLIRLTCAIAILCGSIKSMDLIIDIRHVDFAREFLENTFQKESFDYAGYVHEYQRAQRQKVENTDFIRGMVATHPAIKVLLTSNVFRGNQIREVLGLDMNDAAKIISDLLRRGLLKITGSGAYAPDKLLVEITKQMEVI